MRGSCWNGLAGLGMVLLAGCVAPAYDTVGDYAFNDTRARIASQLDYLSSLDQERRELAQAALPRARTVAVPRNVAERHAEVTKAMSFTANGAFYSETLGRLQVLRSRAAGKAPDDRARQAVGQQFDVVIRSIANLRDTHRRNGRVTGRDIDGTVQQIERPFETLSNQLGPSRPREA